MRRHGHGRVGQHATPMQKMEVAGCEVEFEQVQYIQLETKLQLRVKVGTVELWLNIFMICSRSAVRFTLFAQGFATTRFSA